MTRPDVLRTMTPLAKYTDCVVGLFVGLFLVVVLSLFAVEWIEEVCMHPTNPDREICITRKEKTTAHLFTTITGQRDQI
jgi:hypothetical protein